MSSWLSTTNRAMKEGLGVAKKSHDTDFDVALAKLNQLENDVKVLRKTLETSSLAVTQYTPRARVQMTEVMARLGETFVADSETYYGQFRDAHAALDGSTAEKLSNIFNKVVLEPLDEWLASFKEVRASTTELQKARMGFDHYKDKLLSLEESKRAALLKGKVFDKASQEKLDRNVEKQKESEILYYLVRDKTLAQLMLTFEEAGHRLDFILMRTMQYEKQVLEDGLKALRPWDTCITELLAQSKSRKASFSPASRLTYYLEEVKGMREGGGRLPLDKPHASTSPLKAGGGKGSSYESSAAAAAGIPEDAAGEAPWGSSGGSSSSSSSSSNLGSGGGGGGGGGKGKASSSGKGGNPFGGEGGGFPSLTSFSSFTAPPPAAPAAAPAATTFPSAPLASDTTSSPNWGDFDPPPKSKQLTAAAAAAAASALPFGAAAAGVAGAAALAATAGTTKSAGGNPFNPFGADSDPVETFSSFELPAPSKVSAFAATASSVAAVASGAGNPFGIGAGSGGGGGGGGSTSTSTSTSKGNPFGDAGGFDPFGDTSAVVAALPVALPVVTKVATSAMAATPASDWDAFA